MIFKINKNSIRILTEKYPLLHYVFKWNDGLDFKKQEEAEKNPKNYVLGASPLIKKVLQEDGNWTPFFGENERQSGNFESMACTVFSFLNIIEALAKQKFNDIWNKSDRFTAKMSGVSQSGNTMDNVAESARKLHGLLNQEDWFNNIDELSWYEFYKIIPEEIQQKAKYFLDEYEIGYESVPAITRVLKEQIKYSPIWCAGYAWYPKGNTYYSFGNPNHAFVIQRFDGDNPIAKDSYDPFDKKLDVNFKLYYTKIITLNKKNQTFDPVEIKKLMDRGFKYITRSEKSAGGHGEVYELTPTGLVYKTADEARDIGLNALEERGDYTGISEENYYKLIN